MVSVNENFFNYLLQKGLDDLYAYCCKWGLKVNILKTKIMIFRKGGRLGPNDKWTFGNQLLEVVPAFKYLGCFLTPTGSFSKCIEELTNSTRRALFALKTYFHTNPELLPSTKINLFNSVVSPILFYCNEVWGLAKADPIEKFYCSFLRSVLGVKSNTTNCYAYGELVVFPLYVERRI